MAHKIIMLGGRRSGKSSILSSILYALDKNTSGDLFVVSDQTDYSANDSTDGVCVRLRDKRMEVDNYLKTRQKVGENSSFLVDMTPTKGKSSYLFRTDIKGAAPVDFEFVDVPGEWMEDTSTRHNELKKIICESDVYVIAIDTPYMMQQENENINTVYNRIDEITSMMANIMIDNEEYDKKLIILCPVKCEKWVRHGRAEDVATAVKNTYRTLINTWVNHKAVDIWIMPIQTIGGIEHSKLLDGYRLFKSANDKFGELCSKNELTGQIMLKDGKILSASSVYMVDSEPDKSLYFSYTQIPLSWYITNEAGFSPRFCEQPAYHILEFLVHKEELVMDMKDRNLGSGFWGWLRRLFNPPFGKYLQKYQEMTKQLEEKGIIKKNEDGFIHVESIVN